MNKPEQSLVAYLEQENIHLEVSIYERLFAYLKEMLFTNQTTNLTAIKDYEEALVKHLYDSLVILNLPIYKEANCILDVGSGGGLPGIPLAICSPDKTVFSMEATAKKVNFQINVCEKLSISNHHAVWKRAEEAGHETGYRENFDLVVARALAATDVLVELVLPFVKPNGYAVFYKAKGYESELEAAQAATRILGGEVGRIYTYILPQEAGERNLVIIKKIKSTPSKYPRRTGIPQKSPLK